MLRRLVLALLCVVALPRAGAADGVVVINEVHVQPAAADSVEWIELFNQLAVDVDLGGWRLAGAVQFVFAPDTVIPAGGYVVVAARREVERGWLGPFVGRLDDAGGTIELRNNSNRLMDRLRYRVGDDWPAAPFGTGPTLARRPGHLATTQPDTWRASRQREGTPGADNFPRPLIDLAPPDLQLSEVGAAGVGFFVEVVNVGRAPLHLDGVTVRLARGTQLHSAALPAVALAPDALLAVDGAVLGVAPTAGDRVVLEGPDGRSLDGVVVGAAPRARSLNGRGPWVRPERATPGTSNALRLRSEIVISEIMYDPPSPPVPANSTRGQWIELHNRSSETVVLDGWRLRGGITFAFAPGTRLASGAFVVVAADPARFAPMAVLGPWVGTLSRRRDALQLIDAADNVVSDARFESGGEWPGYADGGGSSLELRDLRADGTYAGAWAASDEGARSSWQSWAWRGTADPTTAGEPSHFHELNLLLADGAGEVLIDDVQVRDLTTGENLIDNGDFRRGMAGWRAGGTHLQTRIDADPEQPDNPVLRLVASGPGEYQGNQLETTFARGVAVTPGRQYEIAFRTRWIGGAARLNARLYFNRLARTHLLAVSSLGGPPGAPNSRAVANAGPMVTGLSHTPAVPAPDMPVTVRVEVADPDGVAAVSLRYRSADEAWATVAMHTLDGRGYEGVVPGRPAGTITQYVVEATDQRGARAWAPLAGTSSRALVQVDDGQAASPGRRRLRLILTAEDAMALHAPDRVLSNAMTRATLIVDEHEVFPDIGVRLKGSYVGRDVDRVGFIVEFSPERLYQGIHERIALDRSQHTSIGQGEIVAKHIASRAGDVPHMYDDLAQCVHVWPRLTSSCQLRLTGFGDDYLNASYRNGDDGAMYEVEVLRWSDRTADGTSTGTKLPGFGNSTGDLGGLGDDVEGYRWLYLLSQRGGADDASAAVATAKTLSLSGAALDEAATATLDVEQWLRTLAYQTLVGPVDTSFTGAPAHNLRLYARPDTNRILYFPWDWDGAFLSAPEAPLVGDGAIARLVVASPHNHRQFLFHVADILETVLTRAYMLRWIDHYSQVAGENFDYIRNYLSARIAHVRGQLPSAPNLSATVAASAIAGQLTLRGSAGLQVAALDIDGVRHVPRWTSDTTWTLDIPRPAQSAQLVVRALDRRGQVLETIALR